MKYVSLFCVFMVLFMGTAFAQVASPVSDKIDGVSGLFNGMLAWLQAHSATISSVLGAVGTFLLAKLYPNSQAGSVIGTVQKVVDSLAALFKMLADLLAQIGLLLHDLIKSDGVGGAK